MDLETTVKELLAANETLRKENEARDERITNAEKLAVENANDLKSIASDVAQIIDAAPDSERGTHIIDWAEIVLNKYHSSEKPNVE